MGRTTLNKMKDKRMIEYSYEKNDKWNVWKFNAPRQTYYGVQVKLYNDSAFLSEAYNTKPMYTLYTQNVYICPN